MATTTNYSWSTPDDTALVKDGAAAIRSLGTAIDTTVFANAGAAIAKTLIDAKGDLIVGSAADTAARLAAGTNGYVLSANSGATNGLEWIAAPGGGKVLQVVQATYSTTTSITSVTPTDTGLEATITPSLATSKVLVMFTQPFGLSRNIYDIHGGIRLLRSSTVIWDGSDGGYAFGLNVTGTSPNPDQMSSGDWASAQYLDSPATTSATTYKTQARVADASNSSTISLQGTNKPAIMILMEIGA
jgi:hypothetical protein